MDEHGALHGLESLWCVEGCVLTFVGKREAMMASSHLDMVLAATSFRACSQ